MAFISQGDMYDKWKKVADWVTGSDTASKPKVTVDSSALPIGAATEAKQTTGNTSLATIAAKDFATAAKQDTGNTSIAAINTATGAKSDAESSSGDGTVIAILKGIRTYVAKLAGSKAIAIGKKTIGTSQIKVVADTNALAGRRKLTIRVVGNDAIYIGPSGVTTSTGFPILPGELRELSIGDSIDIYAIAASNQTLHVIEES